MTKRLLTYTLLATVAFIVAGCSTSADIRQRIDQAEAIVESNPEEALAIMESIAWRDVRGERDKARYALVYSEANYYNRIIIESDTLTKPMMEYYRFSDHHDERARAMYQHALVMQAMGKMPEAMLALLEAEESFAKYDNKRLQGLIHRTRGDLYGEGCLYRNAYDEYALAADSFAEAELSEHHIYARMEMGTTEMLMRHYEEAIALYEEVVEYAVASDNRYLLCEALMGLAEVYSQQDDYAKCAETLDKIDEHNTLLFDFCHYYCLRATCDAARGDKPSSERNIVKATEAEDYDEDMVNYTLYVVHRTLGDTATALMWHEHNKNEQDALILEVLEQPVLNVEVESLQKSLTSEKRERALIRQRNTLIYIGIAIVLIALTLYIRYRMRKKNNDIAQYIATIEELQLANRNLPEEMTASVSALYLDRFSELNHLCDIYYDHSGSSRQKNLVFDKLNETIDAIKSDHKRLKELEVAVNRYRDNVMEQLREVPRLTERDLRIALYTFAGFSNRAISIFLDSDPVSISRYRYNLKQKIKNSGAEHSEQLLNALSDK